MVESLLLIKNKLRIVKIVIGSLTIILLLNYKFSHTKNITQILHTTQTQSINKEDDKNEVKENVLTATTESKEIIKTEENTINWIDIEVTFYTNNRQSCGNSRGISANGTNLLKYTLNEGNSDYYIPIATPSDIPFGTKLYVEGLGNCISVDRGSAIKWKNGKMIIDVFIPNTSERELNKLGRKITRGYIIK